MKPQMTQMAPMRNFMGRGVAFCLGLAMAGVPVTAQTKMAKLIEVKLEKALASEEGGTTFGMVAAYDHASKEYRVEIARVFEKLVRKLPRKQADAVIDSHRQWLRYFESERLCASYVFDAAGTMHRITGMTYVTDLLRHRLAELCRMFLENLQEEDDQEEVPDATYWCRDPAPHRRIVTKNSDSLGPSAFELEATQKRGRKK